MINLEKITVLKAKEFDRLLAETADRNIEVAKLYHNQIKPLLQDIEEGRIKPPNNKLSEYWYYFSPEGPWGIWNKFPDLVNAMSELLNLIILENDAALEAYCRRHGAI